MVVVTRSINNQFNYWLPYLNEELARCHLNKHKYIHCLILEHYFFSKVSQTLNAENKHVKKNLEVLQRL